MMFYVIAYLFVCIITKLIFLFPLFNHIRKTQNIFSQGLTYATGSSWIHEYL